MNVEAFLDRVHEQGRDADRLVRSFRLPPGARAINVHSYGWRAYAAFVRNFYNDTKPRIVALSMNPGPFGAVQTGIPFCDLDMARSYLPKFDELVRGKPAWVRSERREMSARRLLEWSRRLFDSDEGLYERVLLAMTVPVAILKGPRRTNVPLPALPVRERRLIDAFVARHAPDEIRLAEPRGVLLLGDFAGHVWEIVKSVAPDLRSLPVARVPHPAAHITNRSKYSAWTRGWRALERARSSPTS